MRKQRTWIDSKLGKITLKSCPRSFFGNPNGFYIWIKCGDFNKRYYCNRLERDVAENFAFVKFIQEVAADSARKKGEER